jgi:hypothetical protein
MRFQRKYPVTLTSPLLAAQAQLQVWSSAPAHTII